MCWVVVGLLIVFCVVFRIALAALTLWNLLALMDAITGPNRR